MFIRRIEKSNKNSDKVYTYYRLVHTYKVGKKVRQHNLLNLGKLEGVSKEDYKALANRIEEIVTGTISMFSDVPEYLEKQAQHFANQIIAKDVFAKKKKKKGFAQEIKQNYQEINIESLEQLESRTIGGEWLVRQAFDIFQIEKILEKTGLDEKHRALAQQLLTAKLLHPSSELETERWLKENSGSTELYPVNDDHPLTRYRLYKVTEQMYKHKEDIESQMYSIVYSLFKGRNKIVIYDLTNMYFEGRMQGSKKAAFGRSKEKRSDCPIISLALSIDSLGFVRYSSFYRGNISEPKTFQAMIDKVVKRFDDNQETPLIIMDAGIATQDNLNIIKDKKYDYVCVSNTIPSEYEKLTKDATQLTDNLGHFIEVEKVEIPGKGDCFLHIKSEQKMLKEELMNTNLTQKFEEKMRYLKEGLALPRRTKKIRPVHETIGRIKDRFSKVAKLYKITYEEDKAKSVVTDIRWELQAQKQKPKGEYFLRYSKEKLSEEQIWELYNMTRDVEACFRFLKTDLNVRPIYHQIDEFIEPHIWLSIIAYQIGWYIRLKLKSSGINYCWKTIVEKMKSQQISLISVNKKENEKIYAKLITRPSVDQQSIYDALNFKPRPFVHKTKVVPQL